MRTTSYIHFVSGHKSQIDNMHDASPPSTPTMMEKDQPNCPGSGVDALAHLKGYNSANGDA
jgi:hypothetical protein